MVLYHIYKSPMYMMSLERKRKFEITTEISKREQHLLIFYNSWLIIFYILKFSYDLEK